jgi:hypothetical protein
MIWGKRGCAGHHIKIHSQFQRCFPKPMTNAGSKAFQVSFTGIDELSQNYVFMGC